MSWGRKERSQVLAHEAVIHQNGTLSLKILGQVQPLRLVSECKHVGTWVSSATSPWRDNSHKVRWRHHGVPAGSQCSLLQETIHKGVAYQSHASTGGIQTSLQCSDGRMSPCRRWPNSSQCVLVCSGKNLECFRGKETSVSDEKIRKMAKVTQVFVLVMARKLQLAARISRRAPPALFALLQRDRSPWKRQGLLDLCRLRDCMLEKLGTLPPPAVEPDAWERLWKAYPRSWKKLLRAFVKKKATGTEQCCNTARSGMCVAVSEYTDFRVPMPELPCWCQNFANSCNFAQSHDVKAWLEKPVGGDSLLQDRAGPICQKQFHTRARAVDHLAHRADRRRQAIQQDPDLFPKLETDIQGKLDQQDQQERRESCETGEIVWLTAFLPAVSRKPNCL